jgi:hypothetical protein
VQKFNIEPGVMGDLRPFLGLHTLSVSVLYHNPIGDVLQDIALFAKLLLDNKDYPAKIEAIKNLLFRSLCPS